MTVKPRDFFFGPWRAVLVLGITQILAWGALFYPPVLTVPLIAADRGWSIGFSMGGFSLGLLVAGLVSPRVGAAIDRHGGHVVMPIGSLIGAIGLVALVHAEHPLAYLAVWAVLGAAMAASLYDPAFATLGRIFGAGARPAITALTLAGGFASTVSWPVTHLLLNAVGWRGTYLAYAGALALVAAPLHAFALPRRRADPQPRLDGRERVAPPVVLPPT
ncbi:MAG: MFS transporter, partial [Xanthobacteraceae bacterium]